MIDCHFHIWDIKQNYYTWLNKDLKELYKTFSLKDYQDTIKKENISKAIVVQAADNIKESLTLLEKAKKSSVLLGVIAWIDFSSPRALEDIAYLNTYNKLLGFRPMLQDIEDENWILNDKFDAIFKKLIEENLVFEALVKEKHLENIIYLAQKYPSLKIVINHCAKPKIKNNINASEFKNWALLIKKASKEKNIFCKISGLVTECEEDYSYKVLKPYLEHAKECFGSQRLLWGSDWPVVHLKCSYLQWTSITSIFFNTLRLEEKEDIQEKNVYRIYTIK